MTREDFTEEEYNLLKIMFSNMKQFIDILNNSDTSYYIDINVLFTLAEKLDIIDIYMEW